LLKWEFQPEQRAPSWQATVTLQRQELHDLLESQTLRIYAAEVLAKAYARGVKLAGTETGLEVSAFPAECPMTLDSLLGDE
jgi:hypothetical protein